MRISMLENLRKAVVATFTVFCAAPGVSSAQEVVKELECISKGTFNVLSGEMLHGQSASLWHLFYEDSSLVRILAPFACRSSDKRMEILEDTLLMQCGQEFEGEQQTVLGRIDRRSGEFFKSTKRGSEVLVSWGNCTSPDGIF
ncbi:hypothetical protein [Phaeovulum sp. NW3]|uniref:hypothetical protein n=1 Tax=Phaeovulum sp. NW3 TaxID=2934933 RepID=UPI00202092A9|nr:hypothetical protein [Phaeovulum sp. NW3]MCL7465661.1 hypothetical protein [Phaeovulum sp. NW3]